MSNHNNSLPNILLVDDDPALLCALKHSLRQINAKITCCHSPSTTLAYIEFNQPNLVICAHRMPQMTGSALLAKVAEQWPNTQRLLLSSNNDLNTVASTFNHGIIHRYLTKPWDDDALRYIVIKALEQALDCDLTTLSKTTKNKDEPFDFHGMVAKDSAMLTIFDEIKSAATTNVPVFITGETGTGKELIAKACHRESHRKDATFIAINCANFNEQLMESQLFGHKKGAFTGATTSQEGVFSVCASGTLLLDEITTIPAQLQAKLLRVIQEREFTPLGCHTVQAFNAQLITASSTTLREAVNKGEFREDLYYRLNVITISLPPLRERGSDVLLIAKHFLVVLNQHEGKRFKSFSTQAQQLINEFHWPGNIRQLENVIHSIVAMNTGTQVSEQMLLKPLKDDLTAHNLWQQQNSTTIQPTGDPSAAIRPLWLVEKQTIEQAIAQCDGNIPKAAVMLEINPSTIYRKLQSWKKK